MRRKSVKKSSMFKLQAEKNKFQKFLDEMDSCATITEHPSMRNVLIISFRPSPKLQALFMTTVSLLEKTILS